MCCWVIFIDLVEKPFSVVVYHILWIFCETSPRCCLCPQWQGVTVICDYRRSKEQDESQSCDKRWCIDLHSSGLGWWGRVYLQGPEHSRRAHSAGFPIHPKYALCLCVLTFITHMCCGDIGLFTQSYCTVLNTISTIPSQMKLLNS